MPLFAGVLLLAGAALGIACSTTVEVDPDAPRRAMRALQDALASASAGEDICIYLAECRDVAVEDGPLRLNRSATIRAHPATPCRPVFDCGWKSNLLIANAGNSTTGWVGVSGIGVRNGRAPNGGSLDVAAATVRLSNLTVHDSESTESVSACTFSYGWPYPDACLLGGGAILVRARSADVRDLLVRNASTSLSGGAIAVFGAARVYIAGVSARNVSAAFAGGAISVAAGSTLDSSWSVSQTHAVGAAAGQFGGAVSLWANGDAYNCSWALQGVDAQRTTAGVGHGGAGGAVSLWAFGNVAASTWSVAGVRAADATAGGVGGGAVSLWANGDVTNSSWAVAGVRAAGATTTGGGAGGAVSLWTYGGAAGSAWTVADVVAESTAATYAGGAVSLWAHGDVLHCTWAVAGVNATNATAYVDDGGAVALWTYGGAVGGAWTVTRVIARGTACGQGGGGAVFLGARRGVRGGSWTVADVDAADAAARGGSGDGGAVALLSNADVAGAAWRVASVRTARTEAGGRGGAVSLRAHGSVAGSAWTVADVVADATAAAYAGGAVSLWAETAVSASNWTVAGVRAADTRAPTGGVVSVACARLVATAVAVTGVRADRARASDLGGVAAVSAASADRSSLRATSWAARNATARRGAVLALILSEPGAGGRSPLEAALEGWSVRGARGAQGGGVLRVEAGRPYQVPWRSLDPNTCDDGCPMRPFATAFVPLAYAVRVRARGWHVRGASAPAGVLASLENAWAAFADVDARGAGSAARGGLWQAGGYSALRARNVTAVLAGAAFGLLLHQGEAAGNLTLDGVRAALLPGADGPGDSGGAGDVVWVYAGAQTAAAAARGVSLQCPQGATTRNDSQGAIALSESPFVSLRQARAGRRVLVNSTAESVRPFPYASTTLACAFCARGSYLLAPVAWVSADTPGASCEPARPSPNWTLPLCPSRPRAERACRPCPVGAECAGGARVTARLGRWGTTARGAPHALIPRFPVLQFGYACADEACARRFDSCAGSRGGRACGRCRAGYGEALGTAACVAAADCVDWRTRAAWAALPAGAVAVAALYAALAGARARPDRAALTTVCLVLFQSEAIVRANDEPTASPFSRLALFQFAPPSAAVCLWPHMTAAAKAAVPLWTNAAVVAALGLLFGGARVAHRAGWAHRAPSARRYRRALVSLLLVGYGAVAGACMRLVARVDVDGEPVQALSGDAWMRGPAQWAAAAWLLANAGLVPAWFWYGLAHLRAGTMRDVVFGAGLLLPAPALAWHAACRRTRMSKEEKGAARAMFHALAAPYADAYPYADGVFLLQRLSLGLLSVALSANLLVRAFAMALASLVFSNLYARLGVFRSPAVNAVNSLATVGLGAVCCATIASAYALQHGGLDTGDVAMLQTAATWCLTAVPLAALAVAFWPGSTLASAQDGSGGGTAKASWHAPWTAGARRSDESNLSVPLVAGSQAE